MQAHLSTSVSPLPVRGDGTPLRPAAAYLRESDKGQGVHSFDTQLEGATAVLERHGYYVAMMVERDGRKGGIVTRDGYRRIQDAAQRGLIPAGEHTC